MVFGNSRKLQEIDKKKKNKMFLILCSRFQHLKVFFCVEQQYVCYAALQT